VIVRTPSGGSRELRMPAEFGSSRIPSPSEYGSWIAATGEAVTVDKAAGLPAVFNAIRLVAETTGSLPLRVYRGRGAEKRTQERTWQWQILHDMPNDEQSSFDFWSDVAASLETHGNAYIHKVKVTLGRVDAIYVIDPQIVSVQRDRRTGEKLFVIRGRRRGDRADERTTDARFCTSAA
jgi:HK97 family phage portal protein